MPDPATDILTDSFLEENKFSRKRLIPLWIKIFAWIFVVIGALTPLILVVGIVTHNASLAIYGLETVTIYSVPGVIITSIFLFKGITAYGILKRTNWAVDLAVADAVVGILICMAVMVFPVLSNDRFAIRLELIPLIPYLVKMLKIRNDWKIAERD